MFHLTKLVVRHVRGAVGACLLCGLGLAQETPPPEVVPRDVANAILHWVAEFDAGRLALATAVRVVAGGNHDHVRLALRGGVLHTDEEGSLASNFSLLQRLVATAENHPTADTAGALLALAATGFEGDMFDHQVIMVRDLGHFALLRMDDAVVWDHVHAVATSEPALNEDGEEIEPVDTETDFDRPEFGINTRAMWRVAAVRLLGMKEHGVFRSSIESCLDHRDGRVRLAAAEALGYLRQRQSLPGLTRVLSGEPHPMVAYALVEAMHHTLNEHAHEIEAERSGLALRTALARIGKAGWRTDMAIVRLIQNHPLKAAVQPMIALMRNARGESDPILKIINANASLLLAAEAHRAMQRITGAAVAEDPDLWQAFWDAEHDKVVVRRPTRPTQGQTVSSGKRGASFYGIPVLGSNVVFVLDTSGSMKAKVRSVYHGVTTSGRPTEKTLAGSRLDVARYQTLKAVQGMPESSKFSIVSFDSAVRAWNREPVRAKRAARATAVGILSRLRANGGTNVFDALLHVLDGEDVGYGEVSASTVDEVFVLSDGQPSSGVLTEPAEILAVVAEINRVRQVRINTVFAGTGEGADFMRKLAEQNGGVFVQQ